MTTLKDTTLPLGNMPFVVPIVRSSTDAMDEIADMLSRDPRVADDLVTQPHPLLVLATHGDYQVVVAPAVVWDHGRELLKPFAEDFADASAMLVLLGRPHDPSVSAALSKGLAAVLPADASVEELYVALHRAFELMEAKRRAKSRGKSLQRYRSELGEMVAIARTMTTERDVNKLLAVILERARFITGADAGSIYVVEGADLPQLRFKLTQNDSVHFDSREFVMPISRRSISGCAALDKKLINLPDVYELPPGSPFGFDRRFDDITGYRTKSMLVVPLISQRDEVIGIIQLINKKKDPTAKLQSREDVDQQVVAFDERSEELLGMLAAQAAVSLETAMLYEEIRLLFEGFVHASVEAIESRDPTTSGHSRRVAGLTVELAKIVDAETAGPYRDASFTRADLRELEYASLLHDFGKIGVREKVLVKAKKLYDERLSLLRTRFDFVSRTIEVDVLTRKLHAYERGAAADVHAALDAELSQRRADLDAAMAAVLTANEPTVLSSGDFAKIEAIAQETYTDLRGEMQRLLDPEDVVCLKVKQGSLTQQEFDEIRSHVSHTFRFLSQIPWGKALRRVPIIAGAHHERLNGTGYPNRLRAEEIPVQSKMMSIADIYDALTASDRPYKKAVPVERAIDILEYNVKDGHLDAELMRIFKAARVWERVKA
jgi:HD-GYP domain-containing protein (c-di-GMP phosphodiesterase class II)